MINLPLRRLLAALKVVAPAVAGKPTLPVLANVLISTEGLQTVRIAATNLEIGITHRIAAQVNEPMSITINHARLVALLSAVASDDQTRLSLERVGDQVRLTAPRLSTHLAIIDGDEFPTIPTGSGEPLTLAGDVVRDWARMVYAAASDDSRPILAGLGITPQWSACADGFRLAMRRANPDAPALPTLIIPPAFLRALDLTAESYSLWHGNQAVISDGKTSVTTRLIEGKFPDVARVVPQRYSLVFIGSVDRALFVRAVTAAMVTSANDVPYVKFKRKAGGAITLHTKNDTGDSVLELEVNSTERDGAFEIALNGKYVLDMLKSISGDSVTLSIANAQTPAMCSGVDGLIHIIMPLTLR